MAARGMATGQAALGAELLNRDRYATQREAGRRSFAADANNLRETNTMNRRDAAGRLAEAGGRTLDAAGRIGMASRDTASQIYDAAGRLRLSGTELGGRLLDQAGRIGMTGREIAGNLYDTGGRLGMTGREISGRLYDAGGRMNVLGTQTAGDLRSMGADTAMSGRQIGGALLNNSALLRQAGAGMLADLDPYQRAIQGGLSLGQTAQAGALDTVQGGFNNALDLFANTGSFNVNRGDSLYNSWLNNATAIKTGQTAANATTQAANITAAATRNANKKPWWQIG
jgi:hypothetical protein